MRAKVKGRGTGSNGVKGHEIVRGMGRQTGKGRESCGGGMDYVGVHVSVWIEGMEGGTARAKGRMKTRAKGCGEARERVS